MQFFDLNNNLVLDVMPDDKSFRYKEIMVENKLYYYFSSASPVHLPLFCWCMFQGEKYFLLKSNNFKKINTENHQYTLELDTYQAYLDFWPFELFTLTRDNGVETINSDREIEFSLTHTPLQFVQLLVDNMNQADSEGGWTVGEVVEAEAQLLDFNDVTCLTALGMFAEAFKTEWEVEVKTIHLRKIEKFKDNPLPLMYGKDNGLLSGLERLNFKNPIGAVRIKTSNRNINSATYGSATLRMPKNRTIRYEGVDYVTDSTGSILKRLFPVTAAPIIRPETLDLTHIYPKHVGTVSQVIVESDAESLYDIVDEDNTIDYAECVIPGEKSLVVVFQDGPVAGIEFDAEYIHADKTFKLVPLTRNGVNYPQAPNVPAVGNKYAVFYIELPQQYITEAETNALNETVKFLFENEKPQFTYKAKIDEIFSKRRWLEIGGYINNIGSYVSLNDPQYLSEPVDIRVISIKTYVNKPMCPEITLSNSVTGKTIKTIINELPNTEQIINRNQNQAIEYSKKRYRDSEELASYLAQALLNFSEGINPITVHAMMQYLGSKDLQFRWVDSKINPTAIDHAFTYNPQTKKFSSPAGIIQHMTLGIDTLSPGHSPEEYHFWDVAEYPENVLLTDVPLWLYIKAEKNGTEAVLLLSETAFEFDTDPNYYYLLTGFLNSEFDGDRAFTTLYGFSEWTPGQLRIDKMASTDGAQYIDWLNKRVYFGDDESGYSWNVDRPDKFVIRGGLVQSPSGDTAVIGVWRGDYSGTTQYYVGDEFYYNGSTYRCIVQPPDVGVSPTNTTYFKVSAAKGDPGSPGSPGSTGSTGPGIVFRGDYAVLQAAGETIFYNNSTRRDVVYRNSTYYVYNGTNGQNNTTWVASRWQTFGAQFSSVATNLLLAELANIAGWIFRNERLESQSGGAYLDGRDGTVNITGAFTSNSNGNKIVLDPSTRSFKMINSNGNEIIRMSFDSVSGYQSLPRLEMFMYNSQGILIFRTVLDYTGFSMYDGSGNIISQVGLRVVFNRLSTIDPVSTGVLWCGSDGIIRRSSG